MNFENRFSMPHMDKVGLPNEYYTLIKNASEDYRSEINDIYFGAIFVGNYLRSEQKLRYGNVMGVYAYDEQINYLFKIQDEFNIPISLTLNPTIHPVQLLQENQMMLQFINWLGEFYERGLRRCTLTNVHMLATGVLQKKFPEMIWKSSVNQNVNTPQDMIDLIHCGYNVIQLGRSVNRNTDLLPEFKKIAKKYNVQTSMTVSEKCLPNCPFKSEHDSWHETLEQITQSYFGGFGVISCQRWTTDETVKIPRITNDVVWMSEDVLEYYFDHVDIFKFTGRMVKQGPTDFLAEGRRGKFAGDAIEPGSVPFGLHETKTLKNFKFVWRYPTDNIKTTSVKLYDVGVNYFDETVRIEETPFTYAESFKEIFENKLSNYSLWDPIGWVCDDFYDTKSWDKISENIWSTDKGQALERKLMTCQNQCYDCHACEDTFGVDQIDSLVGMNSPAERIDAEQLTDIKEWDERNYLQKREDEKAEQQKLMAIGE